MPRSRSSELQGNSLCQSLGSTAAWSSVGRLPRLSSPRFTRWVRTSCLRGWSWAAERWLGDQSKSELRRTCEGRLFCVFRSLCLNSDSFSLPGSLSAGSNSHRKAFRRWRSWGSAKKGAWKRSCLKSDPCSKSSSSTWPLQGPRACSISRWSQFPSRWRLWIHTKDWSEFLPPALPPFCSKWPTCPRR